MVNVLINSNTQIVQTTKLFRNIGLNASLNSNSSTFSENAFSNNSNSYKFQLYVFVFVL